jgi:hypothetical protein
MNTKLMLRFSGLVVWLVVIPFVTSAHADGPPSEPASSTVVEEESPPAEDEEAPPVEEEVAPREEETPRTIRRSRKTPPWTARGSATTRNWSRSTATWFLRITSSTADDPRCIVRRRCFMAGGELRFTPRLFVPCLE